MSTKKDQKSAKCENICAKDKKSPKCENSCAKGKKDAGNDAKSATGAENDVVKPNSPKWGTPDWAYANPWTTMDRKRRRRVLALGVLNRATVDIIDRLDDAYALAKLDAPKHNGCQLCAIIRHLCTTARANFSAAVYDLSYVADSLVAADLVAAWEKADDAK